MQRIQTFDQMIGFLDWFHQHAHGSPEQFRLEPECIPDDLPAPLGRLYQSFGALIAQQHGPFNTQDTIVLVDRLKRLNGLIEFAHENQGCWSCYCAPHEVDPPVLSDPDATGQNHVVCDSLEGFLITLCLQEAVMGCAHLIALDTDTPERVLNGHLKPVWLNGPWIMPEQPRNYYALEDAPVLVMHLSDIDSLWIGTPINSVEPVLRDGVAYQAISPWG